MEIRLIKTPRTERLVAHDLGDLQALPGTPWSLNDAMSWSKREFIIYADANDVVGLSVDGKLPKNVYTSVANYGWRIIDDGRKTLIVAQLDNPLPAERHNNLWLTLPLFDGAVMLRTANNEVARLPFHLSNNHNVSFPLDMRAFIPSRSLALSNETEILGSFALPGGLADAFLPANVAMTFPGLRLLSEQTSPAGIDLLLGQDAAGVALALATTATKLTLEELGEIASEGIGTQNLSTLALTIDGLPTSLEIRNQDQIDVTLDNSGGLNVAVAKNSTGQLFRLTQSADQLIVSNRAPVIGLISAKNLSRCLHKPAGFIRPRALAENASLQSETSSQTLFGRLQGANEIAFKKNRLRICW